MARIAKFPRVRQEPLFLFDIRRPAQPASAAMIDQVITHADVATRLSGGRVKLRVSRDAIRRLQAQGRLAADGERLADLTVIWNEYEGQVETVRDDARLRDAAEQWAAWDALFDEESFTTEYRSAAA
jgi:hypothetical protein